MKRRSLLAVTGALALVPGCAIDPDKDHIGPDAPSSGSLPRVPRTAWVFSSGGPRCFVHVGVIKALDELSLRPDLIVGASAGSLVGVLYASGIPARKIVALALELQPWRLARLVVGSKLRFSGRPLADFVREHVNRQRLEQLPTTMVCVAQRLDDGAVIGFNRGDAGIAVQAASAIEGRFTPVQIRGWHYADADQRMPLPVRFARKLGATRVLAVDASAYEDRAPAGAERYRDSDLRKRVLTRPDAAQADVLLHPEFGYWVSLSREFRERAIDAGYRATLAVSERIRVLHAV